MLSCRVSPSGGDWWRSPSTTRKIGLTHPPPHTHPHSFDPKMSILSFSCSFWSSCPNCPHTSRPHLGNLSWMSLPTLMILLPTQNMTVLLMCCKNLSWLILKSDHRDIVLWSEAGNVLLIQDKRNMFHLVVGNNLVP